MVIGIDATTGVGGRHREELERRGLTVVEGALPSAQVDALVSAVDRVWADHRARGLGPHDPLHLLGFVGRDDLFLELIDHPKTFPLVHDLLGWNIFMYHCHLDVHPPVALERRPRWEWHQDGGRQNVEIETHPRPRLSVKVAYFLSDVSEPGRGNLRVIPGSHLLDTLQGPEDGGDDPPGAVQVLAGPGAAVIFDRRVWHSRTDNRSAVTRKALFYAYTYRWIRPRDDLGISPERLERLTPVRRQLLGARTGAIGHWIPSDEDVPLRGP